MLDWDKLRIFHAVAVAQSLTKAGEALNVSQSAISRQISALESTLQVALFHRHARGLMLTEQGEILFSAVNSILSQLTAAENALIETRERPHGPLKVTAPVGFGSNWLSRVVREFDEQFPEITMTLLVDDREFDLTMREADVAIRLFPARHPDLVQKKLATFSNSLYASKEYIAKYGIPKKPEDLAKHKIIAYPEDVRLPFAEINWPLKISTKTALTPALRINSIVGIFHAMESGFGIAGLPDYMMQGNKNAVKILPENRGPSADMYFIYPMELRNSKRINVFRDFLVRKLRQVGLTTNNAP